MSSGRLTTGGKLELGGMDISGGEIKIQSNASLTSSTSSSVDISGGNILNNGELLIEQGVGRISLLAEEKSPQQVHPLLWQKPS